MFLTCPSPTPTPTSAAPTTPVPTGFPTPTPTPTQSGALIGTITDDALNAAIAGALVGAAATAAVTLLIFIIDRIIRNSATFREMRRQVMATYMEAMAVFVIAATAPALPLGGFAAEAASLVAARSQLVLALGTRHRAIGLWLVGMEASMTATVGWSRSTPSDLGKITNFLELQMRRVFHALTNLQQRQLYVSDFTLPGGTMWLAQEDPTWAKANAPIVEWSYTIQNAGRWNAVVASVIWVRNRIIGWIRAWGRSNTYVKAP